MATNYRAIVVANELAEVGTLGGSKSGDDKYIKFYNERNGTTFDVSTTPWCAIFQTYHLRKAGVPTSVCPDFASCTALRDSWLIPKKIWKLRSSGYKPQMGDLIMFNWNKDMTKVQHVGMVEKVVGSTVYTIEGNSKNGYPDAGVRHKSYSINSAYIVGYGALDYEGKGTSGSVGYDNGSLSTAQVKEMQAYYGLAVDGFWGPNSQKTTGLKADDAWAKYQASKTSNNNSAKTDKDYTVGADNEHTIYNFLTQVMELNMAGACGVLANIQKESSFNPTAMGDNGTSYGICQWHNSRYTNLKNFAKNCGKDHASLDAQLWFLKSELEGSYASVLKKLKAVANTAQGSYDGGYAWCADFEKPNDTINTAKVRGSLAKDTYWPKYSGNSGSNSTSPTTSQTGSPTIFGNIKTGKQLAEAATKVAKSYKTLYVSGCFGSPMTDTNKKRYTTNNSYNKQTARTKMINAASSDTFGFDCVCLIKGLLWGWNGNLSDTYGGARYATNGVPDIGEDKMITLCSGVSENFNQIEVGEVLWMSGHIGIYIGDGLAVECTPSWKNGVQITSVNRTKIGYNRRNWTKHGKLPYVSYSSTGQNAVTTPTPKYTDKIKAYQNWLNNNFSTGTKLNVDGDFGPKTRQTTIIAIQKTLNSDYGKRLAVDGSFGMLTSMAFPMLKLGSKGKLVYILQGLLYGHGYDPNGFDGSFGNGCMTAVNNYLTVEKFSVNGTVTGAVMQKLCNNW